MGIERAGAGSPTIEQGKIDMTLRFSECIALELEPPRLVLKVTTGLMRFYPAFLKASMLLQRFVQ